MKTKSTSKVFKFVSKTKVKVKCDLYNAFLTTSNALNARVQLKQKRLKSDIV